MFKIGKKLHKKTILKKHQKNKKILKEKKPFIEKKYFIEKKKFGKKKFEGKKIKRKKIWRKNFTKNIIFLEKNTKAFLGEQLSSFFLSFEFLIHFSFYNEF